MASSKSSERVPDLAVAGSPRAIDRARFRGHRGGLISTHRALARLEFKPRDLVASMALVVLLSLAWIASLPFVCRFWGLVFAAGTKMLALDAPVLATDRQLTSYLRFSIPYLRVESIAPGPHLWWIVTLAVLVLFGASLLLTDDYLPLAYVLRAALCVQMSANAYFAWSPARFPHTAGGYLEGLVSYGIVLISLVPALFGLTYFIFDFSLARKALLTLAVMIHLCLFVPLQALLHAVVLSESILFMPLLYIVFGLPLDILIVIAFYSWGMSWPSGDTDGRHRRPGASSGELRGRSRGPLRPFESRATRMRNLMVVLKQEFPRGSASIWEKLERGNGELLRMAARATIDSLAALAPGRPGPLAAGTECTAQTEATSLLPEEMAVFDVWPAPTVAEIEKLGEEGNG